MSRGPELGGTSAPPWEAAITGYHALAASGLRPQEVLQFGTKMLYELLHTQRLSDLGTLQEYLHHKQARMQLTSWPFNPNTAPGCVCVDPLTDQLRPNLAFITIGQDDSYFGRQLAAVRAEHEANVDLLRTQTGLLVARAGSGWL